MNVFIINGSPRKDGNSYFIAEKLLEKYEGAEFIHLNDLTYKGCQSCYQCRKNESFCVVKDDLGEILPKLVNADLIILITPNYYGQVSGQVKLFLDRWYCLKNSKRVSKMKQGAKLFFVVTQGAPNRDYANNMVNWAKKVFEGFNLKFYGYVVPGCHSDNVEVAKIKIDDMKMHLNMFV